MNKGKQAAAIARTCHEHHKVATLRAAITLTRKRKPTANTFGRGIKPRGNRFWLYKHSLFAFESCAFNNSQELKGFEHFIRWPSAVCTHSCLRDANVDTRVDLPLLLLLLAEPPLDRASSITLRGAFSNISLISFSFCGLGMQRLAAHLYHCSFHSRYYYYRFLLVLSP